MVLSVSLDARKLHAKYTKFQSGKFGLNQGKGREFCFAKIVDTGRFYHPCSVQVFPQLSTAFLVEITPGNLRFNGSNDIISMHH